MHVLSVGRREGRAEGRAGAGSGSVGSAALETFMCRAKGSSAAEKLLSAPQAEVTVALALLPGPYGVLCTSDGTL